MEAVRNSMMDIHCKRHYQSVIVQLVLPPSYHRREEFTLIKNVNIKMFVSNPGQIGRAHV